MSQEEECFSEGNSPTNIIRWCAACVRQTTLGGDFGKHRNSACSGLVEQKKRVRRRLLLWLEKLRERPGNCGFHSTQLRLPVHGWAWG